MKKGSLKHNARRHAQISSSYFFIKGGYKYGLYILSEQSILYE